MTEEHGDGAPAAAKVASPMKQASSSEKHPPGPTPLLTIIVPVYNVRKFLRDLVSTLSVVTDHSVQVLFIEDRSTDGSVTYLKRLLRAWPNRRYAILHHERNCGLSAARNSGLEAASGEYVWFIDSDDFLDSSELPRLIKVLDRARPDVLLLDFMFVRERLNREVRRVKGKPRVRKWNGFDIEHVVSRDFPPNRIMTADDGLVSQFMRELQFYCWSMVVRRSLFEDLRFPEGRVFEDIATSPTLIMRARTAYYFPGKVLMYRQRSNSIMSHGAKQKYLDLARAMANNSPEIRAFAQSGRHSDTIEIYTAYLQTLVWAALELLVTGHVDSPDARETLRAEVERFKEIAAPHVSESLANLRRLNRRSDYLVAMFILRSVRLFVAVGSYYRGSMAFKVIARSLGHALIAGLNLSDEFSRPSVGRIAPSALAEHGNT